MMQLDHTIVPVKNKEEAAKLMSLLFGLPGPETMGHFSAVKINDSLTFDFASSENVNSHHYAFWVDQKTFDESLSRVQEEGFIIGSKPLERDGKVGQRKDSKHFYFFDPDG
ncbi:MAG: VOC family protein, partial [Deltaproteobacteria bacterium]